MFLEPKSVSKSDATGELNFIENIKIAHQTEWIPLRVDKHQSLEISVGELTPGVFKASY